MRHDFVFNPDSNGGEMLSLATVVTDDDNCYHELSLDSYSHELRISLLYTHIRELRIMVKAVTRYEASDGSLHDDITEARRHDALYKRMSEVKSILMSPRMGTSPNMICLELTNNPEAVTKLRDALNGVLNFHRTYGKLRKA